MYPFKLPVCGKELEWKPLSVQESLDAVSLSKGLGDAEAGVQQLIRRIRFYDGKEGTPSRMDWSQWDDLDYEFFAQEVAEKEGARRAAFRKKQEGISHAAQVKQTLDAMKENAAQFLILANAAVEAILTAERALDPTKSG